MSAAEPGVRVKRSAQSQSLCPILLQRQQMMIIPVHPLVIMHMIGLNEQAREIFGEVGGNGVVAGAEGDIRT